MVVATTTSSRSSIWSTTRFSLCSKNALVNSTSDTKPAVHKDLLPPQPWTDTPEQQEALQELQACLSNNAYGSPDKDTLRWFLRDSEFKVSTAESKLKMMLCWRAKHRFLDVTLDDVYSEYQTGKAVLHNHTDQFGRTTLIVRASKHTIGEFPMEDSKRLATLMLDSALKRIPASANGVEEQLLLIIDLNNISMSNIDLLFVAFVVDTIPEHYPRRIGQVLFVDAPWVFKAPWETCKHMLRKYAALVRFISSKELAEEYFTPQTLPDIFKK